MNAIKIMLEHCINMLYIFAVTPIFVAYLTENIGGVCNAHHTMYSILSILNCNIYLSAESNSAGKQFFSNALNVQITVAVYVMYTIHCIVNNV